MSFLSPLDVDLAVVYLPLMPVRLVELLRERGIEFVEVPDEEFESMGPNVLALGPRVALALEGNDETRRRMEAAGVDVRTYKGDEISRKGDGGPTCLTRPLLRWPSGAGSPLPSSSRSSSTNSCSPVRCALPSTSVTTAGRPATSASPTTRARELRARRCSRGRARRRAGARRPASSRARRADVPLPHGERSTSPSAKTVTFRCRSGGPSSIRSKKMTP